MKIRVRELRQLIRESVREAAKEKDGVFYKNKDIVRPETSYRDSTVGDIVLKISSIIEPPSESVQKCISILSKVRDANEDIRGVPAKDVIKKFLAAKLSSLEPKPVNTKTIGKLKAELKGRMESINVDAPKLGTKKY